MNTQGRRDAQELFGAMETNVYKCNLLILYSWKIKRELASFLFMSLDSGFKEK